jgi:hypothetical protein
MIQADPIDAKGRLVKLGDWVRVLQTPLSINKMPHETKAAFSRAIGHTLQVHSIQRNGDLELHMYPKVSADTIWIEACCCSISRRPPKASKAFEHYLADVREWDKERGRPEWRVQP